MVLPVMSPVRKLFNILYGRRQENIFFLHIPKCGGTSIESVIKKFYLFSNIQIAAAPSLHAAKVLYHLDDPGENDFYYVLKVRENLLAYFMSQDVPFISGHVSFSEPTYRRFHQTYNYITLLRDPVKRWLSHYFYNRYKTDDDHCKLDKDVTTFLQSENGKNLGHLYVKMIGGLDISGNYASLEAIERAKANLHKFEIVGCLEYFEIFVEKFEQRFDMKLKIPKKNRNPKSQKYIQSVITKDIEEEVTQLCQPDLEIYQYAVDTLVRKDVG